MRRTETGDRSRKEWGRPRGVRGTRQGERDAACVGMDQCVNGCCLTRTAEIIVSGPDGCFGERDYEPRLIPKHADRFPSILFVFRLPYSIFLNDFLFPTVSKGKRKRGKGTARRSLSFPSEIETDLSPSCLCCVHVDRPRDRWW